MINNNEEKKFLCIKNYVPVEQNGMVILMEGVVYSANIMRETLLIMKNANGVGVMCLEHNGQVGEALLNYLLETGYIREISGEDSSPLH